MQAADDSRGAAIFLISISIVRPKMEQRIPDILASIYANPYTKGLV
jgi:hypothetical protein